jgi:hypothetical protein
MNVQLCRVEESTSMLDGPRKEEKAIGEDPSLRRPEQGKLRPHELTSPPEREQAPRCAMATTKRLAKSIPLYQHPSAAEIG